MAVKKPTQTPAKPVPQSKLSSMTLGDVFGKVSRVNMNQLVYILLLISFSLAAYLFGRMQGMEKAGSAGSPTAAAPGVAPQGAPAAPTGPVDVENGNLPVKGDEDAPVTIVEFSDFECPFCGRFYVDTLPTLIQEYIDTGKAKLYFRHFPLSFHPQARPLALASECANEQGVFWEYHDIIFDNNATISSSTSDTYKQWAADLGMDTGDFNECLDSEKYAENVDTDTADGTAAGVSGTPTFYINGLQLVGAQPIDAFKKIIDAELAK